MLGKAWIAASRHGRYRRPLLEVNAFRDVTRILGGELEIRTPACCRFEFFALSGAQTVDGLLYKRPALTKAAIHLLGQDLEALVAENNRLALARFRERWDNGQMITRVQRDGLGDYAHVALEAIEPGVHIV
ncbi:hypothetical protein SAMN05444169_0188 [Bradyrhizobium erythrophlei]|uniref:Uncharacterized protein n=1 Tax=Bradyrhizobium erythrophlei TaxID=1437360 RepID=A0A1M5GJN7_9BRAD|nr:hypothetical protein SAMN05444169_0188 [Bradyrhizobium erythrophlei]